jgi:hypothetical protein
MKTKDKRQKIKVNQIIPLLGELAPGEASGGEGWV